MLIPWRTGGDRFRLRNLTWLIEQHTSRDIHCPIHVAEQTAGTWCKAAAIRAAAQAITSDLVVVHDADVWCDNLPAAIQAVHDGAHWAVPHDEVHRLTRPATQRVLDGAPLHGQPCHRRRYTGVAAGGILVIPRATLLDVPPDIRFTGWGGEDFAWRDALRTLIGREWRDTSAPLTHLWHPPQQTRSKHIGSKENRQLCRRYTAARDQPDRMRALIEETRA